MQQTVEEFKQQHAKECGFDNWKELIESFDGDVDIIDFYYNATNLAYVEQEVTKHLKTASELCKIKSDGIAITNIKIDLT